MVLLVIAAKLGISDGNHISEKNIRILGVRAIKKMIITEELKSGLDLALNEATLNYIDLNKRDNSVKVVLDCIALELNGEFPSDTRVILDFVPIGRIAVSYRLGEWNDGEATIRKISDEQELIKSLKDLKLDSMYGWEFINNKKEEFEKWQNKISFDYSTENNLSQFNTIDLFAEQIHEPQTTVDVRIWFKDFKIYSIDKKLISLEEFIERGKKGWERLYNGGILTKDHKIWGLGGEKE